MLDLVIHGGTVVTPSGVGQFDIGIQGEKIVLVAARGAIFDEFRIAIDATGKYVFRVALNHTLTSQPGSLKLGQGALGS